MSKPAAEAPTAFALIADYADTFAGGTANVNGEAFDVKQALDAGKGTIVTDDPAVIDALTTFPLLERVTAPKGAKPVAAPDPTPDPA